MLKLIAIAAGVVVVVFGLGVAGIVWWFSRALSGFEDDWNW